MAEVTPHGRPRGRSIPLHRLEAFSDAVFAFAVTLLVVSLSVPTTAQELFHELHGFAAFGVCFVLLILIWIEHNRFFHAYPLTDSITVTLNMALLFVVLLYVYPLKFLFTHLIDQFMGEAQSGAIESESEVRQLMIVYGLGVIGLNAVMWCMRANVRRHAGHLNLTARDLIELSTDQLRNTLTGAVALASVLISALTRDAGIIAGFIYFLIGPAHVYASRRMRLQVRDLNAREAQTSAPLAG